MKYQITDPKGVLIDGKRYKAGETLPGSSTSSQIKAFLRFRQIKPVEPAKEPAPDPDPPKAPSTVDELKAALAELDVEIPEGARKAELEELYAKATADPE